MKIFKTLYRIFAFITALIITLVIVPIIIIMAFIGSIIVYISHKIDAPKDKNDKYVF